tara:strand:- start:300 stop:503 length:204 start_codon:yes stop_codon:yes gene_type:complete
MAITYTEGGSKKVRNGNKKAVNLAGTVGYPHSNVRIDTGVNIEDGKPYKRVLPDFGATRVKGPRKKV